MTALKSHHHIKLDKEFKEDCRVWLDFLDSSPIDTTVCRPWVDFSPSDVTILDFYSDASGSKSKGGYGAVFELEWMYGAWDTNFMVKEDPSIEFLELFTLTAAVMAWKNKLLVTIKQWWK